MGWGRGGVALPGAGVWRGAHAELLPPGELPWLRRDSGYLGPLQWEHGGVPRPRNLNVCPYLSLTSKLVRAKAGASECCSCNDLSQARQLLAATPHAVLSLLSPQGKGNSAPLWILGSSLETCSHFYALGWAQDR